MASQVGASPGAAHSASAPDDEISGNDQEVGLDILAGLSTLGISPALRDKVQEALMQLSQQETAVAGSALPAAGKGGAAGVASTSGRGAAPASSEQVKALEQKLQMSRSIMRKLYFKNVNLEKELAVLQVRLATIHLRTVPGGATHARGAARVPSPQRSHQAFPMQSPSLTPTSLLRRTPAQPPCYTGKWRAVVEPVRRHAAHALRQHHHHGS